MPCTVNTRWVTGVLDAYSSTSRSKPRGVGQEVSRPRLRVRRGGVFGVGGGGRGAAGFCESRDMTAMEAAKQQTHAVAAGRRP